MTIRCDRCAAPDVWASAILEQAGKRADTVARYLVASTLQSRFPKISIPNFPTPADDVQTTRPDDLVITSISYRVTTAGGGGAVQRCKQDLQSGFHPVLLVPRKLLRKARWRAEKEGIAERVSLFGIEDFVEQKVLGLALDRAKDPFRIFAAIVNAYNRRLVEEKVDLSLKITLH